MQHLDLRVEILADNRVVRVDTWLELLQGVDQAGALADLRLLDHLLRLHVETNVAHLGSYGDRDPVLVDALDYHLSEVAVPVRAEHQVLVDRNGSLDNHSAENDTSDTLDIES